MQAKRFELRAMSDDERMLGTGRMNRTGGTATITMPKAALEVWDPGDDGLDMVWFTDDTRLFAVPKEQVEVNDGV